MEWIPLIEVWEPTIAVFSVDFGLDSDIFMSRLMLLDQANKEHCLLDCDIFLSLSTASKECWIHHYKNITYLVVIIECIELGFLDPAMCEGIDYDVVIEVALG